MISTDGRSRKTRQKKNDEKKTKLDSLSDTFSQQLFLKSLSAIADRLYESGTGARVHPDSLERIATMGIRGKSIELAVSSASILLKEKPTTLRGLFYRNVSAGFLPSTDNVHYNRCGRLMTRLRESGFLPFEWIVDSVRQTLKPSSWSGLADYIDTIQNAYRLDFWERLPDYVHIIVEKDAIAGVLQPVTDEFDVALSPLRGYASLSFAHEIADTWNRIEKPVHAFYLGDYDPSGFDIERDIRAKLTRYCDRPFEWHRLGVNREDFALFDLLPLAAKKSDRRYSTFVTEHGLECAEVDAIPATELRQRVRDSITQFIPQDEWERLQLVEENEKQQFAEVLGRIG